MNRILQVVFSFLLMGNVAFATTYYSQNQPSQSFADLTNWNTATDGSGVAPVAGDLTSGLHVFDIQGTHTVQIDQDINVDGLIVETNGLLEIGNDATVRNIIIVSSLFVDASGTLRTQNSTVIHSVTITGNSAAVTNLGSMLFRRDGDSFSDVTMNCTGLPSISGTLRIFFNSLTLTNSGVYNSSGTMRIQGDLNVSGGATLQGSANFEAYANVSIDNASSINMSAGNFQLTGSVDQTLSNLGDFAVYRLWLNNGPGADGVKTVNGKITVENQFRIFDDAVFAGSDSVIVESQLRSANSNGWIGSGVLVFGPPSGSGSINFEGNTMQLGSSKLVLKGATTMPDNGTSIVVDNDVEVQINVILNTSNNFSQLNAGTNSFILGDGARMWVRGFNNFPAGFGTYTLSTSSRVDYDRNIATQLIRGDVVYGDLYLRYGAKVATGSLTVLDDLMLRDVNLQVTSPGFDLTVGGDVTGQNGEPSSLTCNNNFTLNGTDINQTLSVNNSYSVQNFIIDNVGPITAVRTKNIDADVIVNGDFTATNTGGNVSNLMLIDIDANSLNGNGGTFSLGPNVQFMTSGATAFDDMFDGTLPSFSTATLDVSSTIEFDASVDQEIPGLTYGDILLDNDGAKNVTADITIMGSVDGDRDNLVFTDNGFEVTLYGNWDFGDFGAGQNRTNMTGDFVFSGADQFTNESNFNNVSFEGSGTKTFLYTVNAGCGFLIEDGVTVTSNYDIEVGCDLIINGTGKLTHLAQEIFFDGVVDQNITIADPTTTYLNNVELFNDGNTISLGSDLIVNGFVDFQDDSRDNTLNIDDDTLFIGGDFRMSSEDRLSTTNGTLVFDGNSDQIIENGYASQVYNNMYFRTGGEKRFDLNTFDIDGDVIGEAGLTINQNGENVNISGDWTFLGTIAGNNGNWIYFDGADQNVTGLEFNSVSFEGTGTKTLGTVTSIKGDLIIENGSTLDVSANNYSITIEDDWFNDLGGVFTARNGKVIFVGGNATIETGGVGAGNSFYDLDVELSSSANSVTIGNGATADDDIDVNGDLIIKEGIFYTSSRDVYLGGSLEVESIGRFDANSGSHNLIFDGLGGLKTWSPGSSDRYRQVEFDAVGATWELINDIRVSDNEHIIITNGKFDLNHSSITMNGNNTDVSILGINSELEIDSGAVLTMGSGTGCDLLNNDGRLTILGTTNGLAKITSTGFFELTQIGANAVFAAQYYQINGLRTSGLRILSGSIDPTNNLSNGTFSGGSSSAYLSLGNGVFSSDATISNVTFNERTNGNPTFNISYAGAEVITFENARGTSAGPAREDDDLSATTGQVRWSYTGALFWDGNSDLDGGDGVSWNDPLNWTLDNVVPNSATPVILNNDYVDNYTVNINATDAEALSLDVIEDGTSVKLDLDGFNLTVLGDMSIGSGAEVEQSTSTDTIFVAGSWSNTSGLLDGDNSVIVFNPESGAHSISTNSESNDDRDFNEVIIQGGGNYTLTDISEFNGDLSVIGGTIDIGDVNNEIQLNGSFTVSDSGRFEHSNGLIHFEGTSGTQTLTMLSDEIYDITFSGASKKIINSNIIIDNNIRIEATSDSVLAGNKTIYVNHDWRNLKGTAGFGQSSGGTVVFNGNTTQDIGQSGDAPTDFSLVIFQNTGQKIISQDLNISGDLLILMSSSGSVVEITNDASITVDNNFLMQDGVLRVRSSDGFPTGYASIDLLGGTVEYRSTDIDQLIEGTTYYNLTLREDGTTQNTKTALGDILVENDFRNNNGGNTSLVELNMACNTLTINGGLSIGSGALDIDWGSGCTGACGSGGTLVLGEDVATIPSNLTSFHNLIVDNNGTRELGLANNITVDGNLTLRNSTRFDMRAFTVTNTCLDNPNPTFFSTEDGVQIETSVAAGLNALPANFGTFNLSSVSLVEYQLNGAQDIYTGGGALIYGDLELEGGGEKRLDGTLDVDGYFDMNNGTTLIDNNNNLSFAGSLVAFETFTPSVGTFMMFDGGDQTIRLESGIPSMTFQDVEFSGSGTKVFGDDEEYIFTQDFKSGSNVTIDWVTNDNDVTFLGDSIIVSGSLNHNGGDNDFMFNKAGTQIVDLGANHTLAHIEFKSGSVVNLINNGLNITGNGGTQNFLDLELGATLDLGAMTHYIGQDDIIFAGTLISEDADLVFNQTGTQNIDAFTANNVTFTGTGDKDMDGVWRMNDVIITGSARVDFNGQDTMVVKGNFACTADIDREDGVIRFEMDDTDARTIQTNSEPISQIKFVSIGGNTATYSLVDDLNIDDTLRVGSGATLQLSGNTLRMGFPADGGGQDEKLVIESGASLEIDAGASALFDCQGGLDPVVEVYGNLSVVGTSLQNANISRLAGGNEIDIDILSGGSISAQNYAISNLVDGGLFVASGATIDPVNNFSNGSFSNMQEGNGAYYLHIEADVSTMGSITGITFNHSGPTIGNDFNVRRDRLDGGILTFDDDVLGQLAGYEYELETTIPTSIGDRIVWPLSLETNWIGGAGGAVNDWFTASNWDNGVPDETKLAIIGPRPNNPTISSGAADTAKCRQLEINNTAQLNITDGIDLLVKNDLVLGSGNESPSINVLNPGSDIIVGKSFSTSNNATFVNGGAKVLFNAPSGSATIDASSITFNNIEFNGATSFNILGDLDTDGNVVISNGNVNPSTNNYDYTIAGDWDGSGGTFNSAVNGTVTFDGAIQVITSASFDQVTFDGGGCDVIEGTVLFSDDLTINNCLVAATGSLLDMNGDVLINASGSFDDGGESHTYSGDNWRGTGGFVVNTGRIVFDKSGGVQNIFASKFNNVTINSTSRIDLEGDVDITGDFYLSNSINSFYTLKNQLLNTSGGATGTFTLESGENIYVDGANNFPAGFLTYNLDATSNARYNGTANQTILGGLNYGNLILTNANTKTLSGSIGVLGDLNFTNSTLDVSVNNYDVSVGDDWQNDAGGSFIARNGTVTFNGSGNQALGVGDHPIDGNKSFWNVTVVNSSSTENVDVNLGDIYIDNDLVVTDGVFTLAGVGTGWIGYVGGDLLASGGGTLANQGTYYLNSTENTTHSLGLGNSNVRNVTIDASINTTYQVVSDVTVDGNFILTQGTVDGNGNTVRLGTDINDAVTISGVYQVDRGVLELGNQTSLSVTSSGEIDLIGTQSTPSIVTRRYSSGDYNFSVDGNIKAKNYVFEYMSAQGVSVNSGATIDVINNFSDGTFSNPASGGVCLRIENTQDLINANRIEDVYFPTDPGNGTFNVAKVIALTGSVEFYNASGSLAGESKDNDPSDMISWTGPVKLIWTGLINNDWEEVGNWSATSGPTVVPNSTYDVEIPLVTNQPIVSVSGAATKSLTVEAGAILTLQTPDNTGSDLVVHDGLFFEGLIRTQTDNDIIEVKGNWTRQNGGTYLYTSGGKVLFSGDLGTPTINNGGAPFYDLEIDRTGIVYLATDIDIDNDLLITGGTLDVSSSNYDLTIGGSFDINSTFNSRAGSVTMNSSGIESISTNSSDLYNFKMSGIGTIVASADVTVNNRFDLENGKFEVNSNVINVGDGSGTDLLDIDGGEFDINAGGILKLASGASVFVSTGGVLTLVGDDLSNLASMTNQGGSTSYNVSIQSGGTIAARFYSFDYLGTSGLDIQSGALIDIPNNLSYGMFDNGALGGRYITIRNTQDLTGNERIEYVNFVSDPGSNANNVYKTRNVGNVEFYYSIGVFQGEDYERDPNDLVDWDADMIWTGLGGDTDWDNPLNWDPSLALPIGNLLPTEFTDVIIPDDASTPTTPILNVAGITDDLEIDASGILTISGDNDIVSHGDVAITGILTVSALSNTTLGVYGDWNSSAGTFNNGGNSTVEFLTETGTVTVQSADPFCGLRVNSQGVGSAVVSSGASIDVDCDFTIVNGTFAIGDPSHIFNLAGNWDNQRTSASIGFTESTGQVVFDGAADQSITHGGGTETFYDLTISNSIGREVNMGSNVVVTGDVVIGATSVLDAQSNNLTLVGNWVNNNTNGFVESTSRVLFTGSTAQTVFNAGGLETFYNVTMNNSTLGSALILSDDLMITNGLIHSDGIITTGVNNLILSNTTAGSYTGWNSNNFVFGNLRRFITSNTSTYSFPVSKGTAGTDYFLIEVLNANLTGTGSLTGSVAAISEVGQNLDTEVSAIEGDASGNVQYVGVMGETAAWTLSPDIQPSGGSYSINAYISNFTGLTDNQFGLLKRDELSNDYADWDDAFPAVIPAKDAAGRTVASGYARRSGYTSFSQFGIGISNQPLPIELLSFNATPKEGYIEINWVTAVEQDNDYFTVERSVDGIVFEPIAVVKGAGSSIVSNEYIAVDNSPLVGLSYYRLVQTDYDGSQEDFDIKAVTYGSDSKIVTVYPTIVKDNITVYGSGLGTTQSSVEVYSILGNLVVSQNLTDDLTEIKISTLPSGIYTVIVGNDDFKETEVIVVNK